MDIDIKKYKFVVDSSESKSKLFLIIEKLYNFKRQTDGYSSLYQMANRLTLIRKEYELNTRVKDTRNLYTIIITVTVLHDGNPAYTDSYLIRKVKSSRPEGYLTVCNKIGVRFSNSIGLQ